MEHSRILGNLPYDDAIQIGHFDNHKVFRVHKDKARYQGRRYHDLSSFEREKYDNFLFLRNPVHPHYCDLCETRERIVIEYE